MTKYYCIFRTVHDGFNSAAAVAGGKSFISNESFGKKGHGRGHHPS